MTIDPSLEMACFTSSTLPGENLRAGETDDWVGKVSFSRVSFLARICKKRIHKIIEASGKRRELQSRCDVARKHTRPECASEKCPFSAQDAGTVEVGLTACAVVVSFVTIMAASM